VIATFTDIVFTVAAVAWGPAALLVLILVAVEFRRDRQPEVRAELQRAEERWARAQARRRAPRYEVAPHVVAAPQRCPLDRERRR
jgi:hypothetical protein